MSAGSSEAPRHQPFLGLGRRFRAPDQGDDRVQPVEGDLQAEQDVGAGLRLFQLEDGAAGDDLAPVVDEMADHLFEGEDLRPVVDDGEHDDAEGGLHLGMLVELVEEHLGVLVLLQLDDDPHPVPVRLVPEIRDPLDLLLPHQFGDLLDQPRLVHLVGDLGDDDRLPFGLFLLFHPGAGAHLDDAAAGPVGGEYPFRAVDEAGGGEIGAGNPFHQLFQGEGGVLDHRDDPVHHLGQVVGRDVGGHADRDAGRAVHQQVRDLGGENQRLLERIVVVRPHVHRFLVQVHQHLVGHLRHADFGVAHGRRGVAVDGAEVPLAVHHRVAERKVLGHPDDGVVGGGIAVGMVLADHVADHAGRLLVRLVPVVPHVVHGIEAAPVHRLEAVPHVGERPADDDAHGVVHVGLLHFVFDVD